MVSRIIILLIAGITCMLNARSQDPPREENYFKIMRLNIPFGLIMEVGGLTVLPDGVLGVCTRRGDVYLIDNPTSSQPYLRKFASGLHEPLGLVFKEGSLYCAQRGELTKLTDRNKDGRADLYETVFSWPLSGHYHEYSYGPKVAADGSFFVSGNVAFGDEEWWRGESKVPWRGWVMNISPQGEMQPFATGMRSPCGLGIIDGELFYADNQGDWMPSGGLVHLKKGSFAGHPAGLHWAGLSNSPVKITEDAFFSKFDGRRLKDSNGFYIKPDNVIKEKFSTPADVKKAFPDMQLPSVYLPHGILGISTSEILQIPQGNFGPFAGQVLVGDQGQSKISRVFLEKINGEYQGVAWDFKGGFQSGVLRMAWANDGSLFVGETNRGWGSAGEANEGLQRLIWNRVVPFEMLAVKAMPDGFEIEFTRPVDTKTAEDIASYNVSSFTYKFHPVYGSPPVNTANCRVKGVKVSQDGMKVRIVVDNLRKNYVHTIALEGIREKETRNGLLHATAYYTLNNIPDGAKLAAQDLSTKNSGIATTKVKATTTVKSPGKEPALVHALLVKNTCTACHAADKRQVGPPFSEIAKRKYSVEKMISLIYSPQPQNWPNYSTAMPPMPHVSKDDATKIAQWINSLGK